MDSPVVWQAFPVPQIGRWLIECWDVREAPTEGASNRLGCHQVTQCAASFSAEAQHMARSLLPGERHLDALFEVAFTELDELLFECLLPALVPEKPPFIVRLDSCSRRRASHFEWKVPSAKSQS
jgi:hypothetical protein